MKKFVPAFETNIQASVIVRWLVYSSLLLVLVSCWLNTFPFGVQLALSMAVFLIVIFDIRSGLLNNRNVTKIQCKADGSWLVFKGNLEPEYYRLKDTSTILGSLFFLHFQSKKQSLYLVLANDSMTAEEGRKLRVALRVYKKQLLQITV